MKNLKMRILAIIWAGCGKALTFGIGRRLTSDKRARIGRGSGLVLAKNDAVADVGMVGAANEIVMRDGWIQITPYGEWPNEVGLQVMDREAAEGMVRDFGSIAARLSNDFRGLPFYVGHPDDPDAEEDYPDKKSYGWWKAIEARNDGLYGRAKMSRAGQELLDEGHFMYVSPFWGMREISNRPGAYRPAVLYSVGMTNNPQIPGKPAGRNEKNQPTKNQKSTMNKEQRDQLIKALGLKADASDEEIVSAANEAQKKITNILREKAVSDNKVTAAANEKTVLEGRVSTAEGAVATAEESFKSERKCRIDGLLTSAVNEGRITEADRPTWAGDLVQDFDGKSKELSELTKAVNVKARTSTMGGRRGEVAVPADMITAINEAVKTRMKDTGEEDWNKAFAACERDPALAKIFKEENAE